MGALIEPSSRQMQQRSRRLPADGRGVEGRGEVEPDRGGLEDRGVVGDVEIPGDHALVHRAGVVWAHRVRHGENARTRRRRPSPEWGCRGPARWRPRLGAGPGLRLLLGVTVLGGRTRGEVVEQVLGRVGDLLHRGVEGRLVRLARRVLPLTSRTYCSAAARTSSEVAGARSCGAGGCCGTWGQPRWTVTGVMWTNSGIPARRNFVSTGGG